MKQEQLRALQAITRFVIADTPLSDTLTAIAEMAVASLEGAAFASMSLLNEAGQPTTAITTGPEPAAIDEAQYRTGEGPCLDAWRTRMPVRIDDVAAPQDRYAAFRAAALDHGIHSTLSLPLHIGHSAVGALNLYAHSVHGFSDADQHHGLGLADAAAVLVVNAQAFWGAHALGEQLGEAMQSRAVIEQAKGMLMARDERLDSDAAFALLRGASQRENVKLTEIALRIVERRRKGAGAHGRGPAPPASVGPDPS